jgi:hypothetical protein
MDWADLYDTDQTDPSALDQALLDALAPLTRDPSTLPVVRTDEVAEEIGVPLS